MVATVTGDPNRCPLAGNDARDFCPFLFHGDEAHEGDADRDYHERGARRCRWRLSTRRSTPDSYGIQPCNRLHLHRGLKRRTEEEHGETRSLMEQLEYGVTRLFLLACRNESAGVAGGAWLFALLAARLVQVHVGASLFRRGSLLVFLGGKKFWEVLTERRFFRDRGTCHGEREKEKC